jgi:hypothetical protein
MWKVKRKAIHLLNYVIKNYAMKAYGSNAGTDPSFLTSALDGGEWSTSLPVALPPGIEPLKQTEWETGRSQIRPRGYAEETNFLPLQEI